MFRVITFAFFLVSCSLFSGVAQALVTLHPLESPNKDFKIVIAIGPLDQTSAAVFYKGEQILTLGPLGFLLDSGEPIPSRLISREYHETLRAIEHTFPPKRSEGIRLPHPNPREVRNEGEAPYNESVVEYIGFMKIIFRAYDNGIAFRYEFEPKDGETLTIQKELTEFRFSDDYRCRAAQKESERVRLSEIKGTCESPLIVEISNGISLVLSETSPVGFAPMKFQFGTKWENSFNNLFDGQGKIDKTGKPTSIIATLDHDVAIQGFRRSPWRYVGLTDGETEMLKSLTKENISFKLDVTPVSL